MKAGKFFGGVLSISSLVKPGSAVTPNSVKEVSFLNATSMASRTSPTNPPTPFVSCFPFQDPDCCIDYAVCEHLLRNEQAIRGSKPLQSTRFFRVWERYQLTSWMVLLGGHVRGMRRKVAM
ncbi:hypothetical protein F5X97DRAFT_325010 [Nemania serpens]|nr:hypothetical protein F5X97DRAFT_325010 [Nemania serpens]